MSKVWIVRYEEDGGIRSVHSTEAKAREFCAKEDLSIYGDNNVDYSVYLEDYEVDEIEEENEEDEE